MNDPRPIGQERLDDLLEAIPRILQERSFDESLTGALELLRRGAEAEAAAVFLADGDAPLRELWAMRDPEFKAVIRPRCKVDALEAIRRGGAHLTSWDRVESGESATRTLLLSTDSAPFGAAVLAWGPGEIPTDVPRERWIAAVVELLAWNVMCRAEISKLHIQAERDRRWFKTLDEHLRVLDRERQKFAAVVNQTDTFVFVTDESRTIRWLNRAMAVLLPLDGEGSAWIGKSCRDVCERLGKTGAEADACDCPIRRALEANEVTHEELRVRVGEMPGVLYLTALPIKGVEGTPREAMVLVQDLTGLEALRNSEVRYRILFERNAEAILIVDHERGGVVLANPAAQQLFGYSQQEFGRKPLESLHAPEDWERIRAVYENPPAELAPSRHECRLVTRDGDLRIALVSASRVELDGRSVTLVEFLDITERRRAEQALLESEARKGAMAEAALDAIVSIDQAGRVIEFNPAAERIFGYKRAEVLGRNMAELIIPPSYRELHQRGMRQYLETGESRILGRRLEMTAMRSDGSLFPVELAIARVSSEGPPMFTGFIRDITDRQRAEQALRVAQERLRTVVAASPIILFAIDHDGIVTLSEGRGLSRLGVRENQNVGKSIFEVYADYPHAIENIRRGLAGEEFNSVVEIGTIVFETHYTPLRDAEGEVVGLIGVAIDITERKSLESQLRHAQKMEAIGRLAGGVAHDFNNLLTVIKGHGEVMLNRMSEKEPLRANAEEIMKAGSRGALLTRQLLAFSRKDVSTPEVLEIDAVVRGMEALLLRVIGEDVRLVTRLSGAPLYVRADRGQLEQVIANLAVNARDAMPEGGELLIEVRALDLDDDPHGFQVSPGSYVMLSVIDQGCGMAPEVLSRLFEPFFTTKEQGKGTGLGLSVVYGIVRQSGGDIRVESQPGRGSTFQILLPRSVEAVLPAATGGSGSAPLTNGAILLVEDEDAVRALARDMLQFLGYEVLEASSGQAALDLFEQCGSAIVAAVSDVVMPGMSGVDLARKLTQTRPGFRVLLVSGYTDDSFGAGLLEREGFAFLQKPYTLEDLRRKLAGLIDAPSLGDRRVSG